MMTKMENLSPAVFLDRDGVVCEEKSYITSPEQLEIYPFAVEAIKRLKSSGWKCIIITNQSAVARGMINENQLDLIHKKLRDSLPLDDIFYCPHYPPSGKVEFPYHIHCECRKPKPGMLLKAALKHGIDLGRSYFIGDRAGDIIAGERAGVKTVLVRTGYGGRELEQFLEPNFIFNDLSEFVDYLLI